MIDALLKNDLPRAYGLQRRQVVVTCRQETGAFELGDSVACKKCKAKFAVRKFCDEKTLKVDASKTTITVVDHEHYIAQFNGTLFANGGTCDLLMFDCTHPSKVAFCELGCYSEEYVAKKQKKSHQQMSRSLSRFLKQPCGRAFINAFSEKVMLFGRRDPNISLVKTPTPARGNVIENLKTFITTPFSKPKYAVSREVIEGIDVCFIVVNYPEPYIW